MESLLRPMTRMQDAILSLRSKSIIRKIFETFLVLSCLGGYFVRIWCWKLHQPIFFMWQVRNKSNSLRMKFWKKLWFLENIDVALMFVNIVSLLTLLCGKKINYHRNHRPRHEGISGDIENSCIYGRIREWQCMPREKAQEETWGDLS